MLRDPTQERASRTATRGCTSAPALWTVNPAPVSPAAGSRPRPPCPRRSGSGHSLRCVEQNEQNWPNRASWGLKTSSLLLEWTGAKSKRSGPGPQKETVIVSQAQQPVPSPVAQIPGAPTLRQCDGLSDASCRPCGLHRMVPATPRHPVHPQGSAHGLLPSTLPSAAGTPGRLDTPAVTTLTLPVILQVSEPPRVPSPPWTVGS